MTLQDSTHQDRRAAAIDNLLVQAGRIGTGRKVLFVSEAGKHSVEPSVVAALEARARDLGAEVRSVWPPVFTGPEAIDAQLVSDITWADVTILNHSIGGMLRLRPIPGDGVGILNYATSEEILASPWAQVPYRLWEQVSRLIGIELAKARSWHITCANGTDLRGTVPEAERAQPPAATGFSLLTFPIGTHRPTSAARASGTLALRWLVSSANHDVGEGLRLDSIIHAEVSEGRIVGLDGQTSEVAKARSYLERIGAEQGEDPFVINSWHAGTNPLAFTPWQDRHDLNGWQTLSHNSPRLLHFHAVGHRVPGELSLPVLDPTVTVDGEVYWDRGRLTLLETPAVADALSGYPAAREAFTLDGRIGVEA